MNGQQNALDVNAALARIRELAATIHQQYTAAQPATVWETVKAMEDTKPLALELAETVQQLDAHATANRTVPEAWRAGRKLTDGKARDWIEQRPELAALGEVWVTNLAEQGYALFQMALLVRQIQGATAPAEER